jgi:hypothetical protein
VEWAEEDAGTAKHAAILTIVEAGGTVAQTRLEAVTAPIIRGLTTDVGPPEVSSIGMEISHS